MMKLSISIIFSRFPMGIPRKSKKYTKGVFEGTTASTWSTGGDKRVKSEYKKGFSKNSDTAPRSLTGPAEQFFRCVFENPL